MSFFKDFFNQLLSRRNTLELSDEQLDHLFNFLTFRGTTEYGLALLLIILHDNPTDHTRQRIFDFMEKYSPVLLRRNYYYNNYASRGLTYLLQIYELQDVSKDPILKDSLIILIKRVVENLQPGQFTLYLIQIITKFEDNELRQMALNLLSRLTDAAQLGSLAEAWVKSRHPDLEALLEGRRLNGEYMSVRNKVIVAFRTNNLSILQPLRTLEVKEIVTATYDQNPLIRERATEFLRTIDERHLEIVAQQWSIKRGKTMLNILAERDYIPKKSPSARILMILRLGKLDFLKNLRYDLVNLLAQATADDDPIIAANARQALTQLSKPASRQMLCKLVVENDWPGATQAALEAGYLPTDPSLKAMFYFVTEQWERYDGLDFDGRMLRTYYEAASPALKRRLAAKVRAAGRVDYLSAIAGGESRARMSQVTAEEAGLLVKVLEDNREWARLWSLAVEVPLEWSVNAVRRLTEAHWQPDAPAERTLFEELSLLARQPLTTAEEEINRQVVPAVRRAKLRVAGRINDLAFAPGGPLLAIGTGLGRLVLWNAQTAHRESVLSGFEHSIGHVAFLPGGQLLCAEKTSTKTGVCNLYECRPTTGELIKLDQVEGSYTALAAIGNGQFLAAARDCNLKLWQLDQLNLWQSQSRSLYHWARGLAVKPDGSAVAVLSRNADLYNLPALTNQSVARLGQIGQVATFGPDDTSLIVGRSDGQLMICTLEKGRFQETAQLRNDLTGYESAIEGLATIGHLQTVIAASANGNLDFVDWPRRERTGRLFAEATPLTALKVSPDGAFMAVGDLNGTFGLWDLRPLELRRLFGLPLAKGQPVHMAALITLKESGVEMVEPARRALAYIEAVLRHRFRFDVELSDLPNVQAGEFDIEIEG